MGQLWGSEESGAGTGRNGERLSQALEEPKNLRGGACVSSPRSSVKTRHPRPWRFYAHS